MTLGKSSHGQSTWMPTTKGTGLRTAASTDHSSGALLQDLRLLVSKFRPLTGCAFGEKKRVRHLPPFQREKGRHRKGARNPKSFLRGPRKESQARFSPAERRLHETDRVHSLWGPILRLHGINSHCHRRQQEAESEDPSEERCLGRTSADLGFPSGRLCRGSILHQASRPLAKKLCL